MHHCSHSLLSWPYATDPLPESTFPGERPTKTVSTNLIQAGLAIRYCLVIGSFFREVPEDPFVILSFLVRVRRFPP